MTNTSQGMQPARIGVWALIQVMFFIMVFPYLGRYMSELRNVPNYFVGCGFELVSIVVIAPMFLKASRLARIVTLIALVFSTLLLLYSALSIIGDI